MNYGAELLYIGGGYAAITANSDYSDELSFIEKQKIKAESMLEALEDAPYYGDAEDDHEDIKKGIDIYKESHPSQDKDITDVFDGPYD